MITGGLGPTGDEITRETIAEMLGEELRIDPVLEQRIRERFARRGIKMVPSNIKQAAVISSAEAISNARGTAPGWWIERDGHILVAMPGPPEEMHHMWHTEVLPRLRQRATGAIIFSKTLKVFGLPEETVGELVSSLLSSANPTWVFMLRLMVFICASQLRLRARSKLRRWLPEEKLGLG